MVVPMPAIARTGRFPDKGLAIAIACNAAPANTMALARGVADAFLGSALAPIDPPDTPQGVAVTTDRLQRHAGVYVQPATLQIVRLVVHDGQPRDRSAQRARADGARRESLCATGAAGRDRVRRWRARRVRSQVRGQRPVHFEWRQAVSPSAAVLAPYAGEYVSAELGGAVYRVGVE